MSMSAALRLREGRWAIDIGRQMDDGLLQPVVTLSLQDAEDMAWRLSLLSAAARPSRGGDASKESA